MFKKFDALKLPKLNLPAYQFDIKSNEGRLLIYDVFRKKSIILTPEEWVRQNFLQYLTHEYHYPKSLIKIESGLKFNNRLKRSDIMVYDRDGLPFLLVECKSYTTKISQSIFDQVATYNQTLKAKNIVVTNGMEHFCCEIDFDSNKYKFVEEIPKFV